MDALAQRTDAFRAALRRVRRALDDGGSSLLGRRVLAMCSGGADSVLLVAALAELPRGARAARIDVLWCDHGLREGVAGERDAARAVAERIGATFHERAAGTRVRESGGGIEAAAREWRLGVSIQLADALGCDVVATGHTASDQVESALLSIAGVTGRLGEPSAMPIARELAPGIELVRPLLSISRAQVEAACAAAGLTWANDSSNADPDAHVRNAMRHRVVPQLLDLHPGAGASLVRAAGRARERADAAAALADALLDAWDADAALDVRRVLELPESARRELVARWLARAGLGRGVTSRLVAAVLALADAREGSLDLPRSACVRRAGYHLHLTAPRHGRPRP
jgi:tRNA(Ile)-lysidine synthase